MAAATTFLEFFFCPQAAEPPSRAWAPLTPATVSGRGALLAPTQIDAHPWW
jgi:hypothetical protein